MFRVSDVRREAVAHYYGSDPVMSKGFSYMSVCIFITDLPATSMDKEEDRVFSVREIEVEGMPGSGVRSCVGEVLMNGDCHGKVTQGRFIKVQIGK